MNTYRKAKTTINIVAYVSLFISSIWGLFFMAPGNVKSLFSLCMWVGFAIFPYTLVRNNDFTKAGKYFLFALVAMAVVQILRTAISSDSDLYALGNKWFTLFGNEYTALLMLPPLFTYLGTLSYSVNLLKKTTYVYLAIGLILSVFMKFPLGMLSIFVIVFYPYVNKKYRILIIIAIAESFIKATTGDNPSRMYFIVIGFALCSYVLVYIIKRIKLLKAFAVSIIIVPFLMFIPILNLANQDETTFQKLQEYILQRSNDEDLASDTRTFLYLEMAEDLTATDSWLFGKGAFSRYYSAYFDQSLIGGLGRISSEVPFLNYLLRGGLCYVIVYFGLLIYAVYLGIWKGKNKFVQSIAVIALGWYFNSFVGDITGCRFYHLAFFLLLGCCLSRKWLYCTDKDIERLISISDEITVWKRRHSICREIFIRLQKGSY